MQGCRWFVIDPTLPKTWQKSTRVRCDRDVTGMVGDQWYCRKHMVLATESRSMTKDDLKNDLTQMVMAFVYTRRKLTNRFLLGVPPRAVIYALQRDLVSSKEAMEVALDAYDRARLPRRLVRGVLTLL